MITKTFDHFSNFYFDRHISYLLINQQTRSILFIIHDLIFQDHSIFFFKYYILPDMGLWVLKIYLYINVPTQHLFLPRGGLV